MKLPNGGSLRIIFQRQTSESATPFRQQHRRQPHRRAGARRSRRASRRIKPILVTKDINLRIKADALGLQAEDYETDRVLITDLYTGMFEMTVQRGKNGALPRRMANSN